MEAGIRIGWNKFRQLVPLLTNKDVSLIMRGGLYGGCVRSSMLHGSETWPVGKEEAQLSPSDRAMRLVSSNLANYHATVHKLLIRQVLTKPMV